MLHCPVCGDALKGVERMGVSLDHCSTCQGIWLDQGELSELIHREAVRALEFGRASLERTRNRQEYDALDTTGYPPTSFAAEVEL